MDLQRFPHCILCQHKQILPLETLEISVETVQVHRHHVFQGRNFESHNPKDLRLQHLVAHRNWHLCSLVSHDHCGLMYLLDYLSNIIFKVFSGFCLLRPCKISIAH